MSEAKKPQHRATYARDNRNGGYMVRVEGPSANKFAGRDVPVTLKAGDTQTEKLDKLVWAGKDKESGANVALYSFVAKPKEESEVEF